jgi:hypothetical protein
MVVRIRLLMLLDALPQLQVLAPVLAPLLLMLRMLLLLQTPALSLPRQLPPQKLPPRPPPMPPPMVLPPGLSSAVMQQFPLMLPQPRPPHPAADVADTKASRLQS